MDEDSLKLRYRCSECKNLESHHATDKKRKCGTILTEITEKDYQHYKDKKKKKKKKKEKKEKEKEKEKKIRKKKMKTKVKKKKKKT